MPVNGTWSEAFQPVQQIDAEGNFIRQDGQFREWVGPECFLLEPGRCHLHAALIWPWALGVPALRRLCEHPAIHRTVSFRHVKYGYYSIRAANPNGIVPAAPARILDGLPIPA